MNEKIIQLHDKINMSGIIIKVQPLMHDKLIAFRSQNKCERP
jgi:hypothetical protein